MKKAKAGKADKAGEVVNIAEQMAENVQDKEAKLTGQLADFLGTAAADADMTIHDLIERCATVDLSAKKGAGADLGAEGGLNI